MDYLWKLEDAACGREHPFWKPQSILQIGVSLDVASWRWGCYKYFKTIIGRGLQFWMWFLGKKHGHKLKCYQGGWLGFPGPTTIFGTPKLNVFVYLTKTISICASCFWRCPGTYYAIAIPEWPPCISACVLPSVDYDRLTIQSEQHHSIFPI